MQLINTCMYIYISCTIIIMALNVLLIRRSSTIHTYLYRSLILIWTGVEHPLATSCNALASSSCFFPVLFRPAKPNNTWSSETLKVITILCKPIKACLDIVFRISFIQEQPITWCRINYTTDRPMHTYLYYNSPRGCLALRHISSYISGLGSQIFVSHSR